MPEAEMAQGVITDEMLELERSRLGIKLRPGYKHNEAATKDAIRKFAE